MTNETRLTALIALRAEKIRQMRMQIESPSFAWGADEVVARLDKAIKDLETNLTTN